MDSDERTPVVMHKAPIEQLIHDMGEMRKEVLGELREVRAASERAETAAHRAADEALRLGPIVERHDRWISSFDRRYFFLPVAMSGAALVLSVLALLLR